MSSPTTEILTVHLTELRPYTFDLVIPKTNFDSRHLVDRMDDYLNELRPIPYLREKVFRLQERTQHYLYQRYNLIPCKTFNFSSLRNQD